MKKILLSVLMLFSLCFIVACGVQCPVGYVSYNGTCTASGVGVGGVNGYSPYTSPYSSPYGTGGYGSYCPYGYPYCSGH